MRSLLGSFFLVVGIFFPRECTANDYVPYIGRKLFKKYSIVTNHLPSNKIYRILIDNNGYLWISSDKGLTLYNGTSFKNIISGQDYVSQYKTKEEHLWLFNYDGSTTVIDLKTHQIINSDSVYGLSKLKIKFQQKAFLSARQSGDTLELYKRISDEYVRINLKTRKSELIKGTHINIDGYIRDFDIRKSLFDSLYHHSKLSTSQFLPYAYNNNFYFKNFLVFVEGNRKRNFCGNDYNIHATTFGAIRVNNDLIVAFFDNKIGTVRIRNFFDKPIKEQKVETLLNGVLCTNIAKDKFGNIWISTYNDGLYKFDSTNINIDFLEHNDNHFLNKQISSLGFINAKELCVSYYNQKNSDIIIFNQTSKELQCKSVYLPIEGSIQKIDKIYNRWIISTESDNYITTKNSPYPFSKNIHFGLDKMNIQAKDLLTKKDYLFIVHPHSIQGLRPNGQIKNVRTDINTMATVETFDQQNFFVGSVKGCYYNKKKLPYLSNETIYKVRACKNKLIWSTSQGVYACDTHLHNQTPQILSNEICKNIFTDSNFLYLHNELKIIVFDKITLKKIREINLKKLPNPSYLIDITINNHYIIAATDNGLFYFPKKEFTTPIITTPNIHIKNSLNKDKPNDSFYQYTYSNKITPRFDIECLDYNNLDKVILYRIRKENAINADWANTEGKTQIKLNNPPPGKYFIEYKIISPEQGWEVLKTYTLIVLPAWYQSKWFYSALITVILFFLGLLAYCIHKFYARKAQRLIEEESKIFSIKSKSILAQLKPHFIFNAITPLQSYIIKNDKHGGLEYLNQYSKLLRNLLVNIREEEISIAKEIEFITQYLTIQQKRFNQSFQFFIEVKDNVYKAKIPAMMLQPLIENAIEHGFESKPKKTQILNLVFKKNNNNLIILIEDNGVGMPKDFKTKENHALSIITEQINLVKKKYGVGAINIYLPANNQGTGIKIELPLNI